MVITSQDEKVAPAPGRPGVVIGGLSLAWHDNDAGHSLYSLFAWSVQGDIVDAV